MSSTTFRSGSLVHLKTASRTCELERLQPGERIVPLCVLEAHWSGGESTLADYLAHGNIRDLSGGDNEQQC